MTNKKKKAELQFLKNELYSLEAEINDAHKLASLLNKYCQTYKDRDELYEISYIVKLLEEKLSKVGYKIYLANHNVEEPKSIEDILKNIKKTINNHEVKLVDD